MSHVDIVQKALESARSNLAAFVANGEGCRAVVRGGELLAEVLRAGGKVLICGNGGSLCDASHFAEELSGRFRADRPALAALALSEPGHITCVANDYGFEQVFARGVQALARPGDALVVLSTSGNSPNILAAIDAGKAAGVTTIALLGKGGGKAKGRCTLEIVVPGETADRIQEVHKVILHTWVEQIEHGLGLVKGRA